MRWMWFLFGCLIVAGLIAGAFFAWLVIAIEWLIGAWP